MKFSTTQKLFVLVSVLIIVSLACGTSENSGTLVEPAANNQPVENTAPSENDTTSNNNVAVEEPEDDSSPEPTDAPAFFSVVDVIEVQDHNIALKSAEIKNGVLVASFAIKNPGDSELNVSSLLSFSARNDEGENLDQEIFDCSPGLDGTVVAGDVINGKVCWSGASYPIKIYYDASLFGSGTVVWQLAEDATSDVSFAQDEISSFAVGDLIEVRDHQITLTEATVTNGRLMATFLIENTGSEEMAVSSLLSFSVKNADGTKLDQDFFDCGSGLDGTIIAGDKLKGSICWTGAVPPLKIYYDPSLLGSGTVVWSIGE